MSLSPMQLLIILGIAILVFGTAKLKNAGKDLGGAVKGFKDAVSDEEKAHLNKRAEAQKVLDHDVAVSADKDVIIEDISIKDPRA